MRRLSTRWTLPALALLSALASTAAGATPVNFGLDSSLNLLAFGNLNVSSSDVEGRVAVGGQASISGYSINTKSGSSASYAGTGLTVGGDLVFSNGSIWGGVQVGGAYTPVPSGTVHGAVQHGTGFNFSAEQQRLQQLSSRFDALANTGSAVDQWGTLHFNATGQSLSVFDVMAADVGRNLQIDGLARGAQVLINVHGGMVDFGSHGYTGFSAGAVIFNLVDAVKVVLGGGIDASLLATQATVGPGWGRINGQVVVDNWNSSVQVNDAPLPGTPDRSGSSTGAAVPEPGSWALAALALAAATWAGRRRPSRAAV